MNISMHKITINQFRRRELREVHGIFLNDYKVTKEISLKAHNEALQGK